MNDFELVAVSTFLCKWPKGLSYRELLDNLAVKDLFDDSAFIIVWPFGGMLTTQTIVCCIEDLRKTLAKRFRK